MDYDKMLQKGREDIPEDVASGRRFEIPDVETRKEGSKTVIQNFGALADRFNRSKQHLSKFLLGELGTAGHVDGSDLVLNGSFRRGKIDEKVQEYAAAYVVCPECERPDTKLQKEKGVELLKCEACGARTPIDE